MTSYMQTEVTMIKAVQQHPTSEVRNQKLLWGTESKVGEYNHIPKLCQFQQTLTGLLYEDLFYNSQIISLPKHRTFVIDMHY